PTVMGGASEAALGRRRSSRRAPIGRQGCGDLSSEAAPAGARPESRRTSPLPALPCALRLQLVGVILLDLLDAAVAAEERVLRHVRRVLARRWTLAHRFGERADVVRSGAAADTEVANVERERLLAELGDLVSVAGEWIERDREGARAFGEMPVRVVQ